jgi:predicted Zn finger-like uncharacterized protein
MRIVCDSCSTKYSISDEKVRGKLFKFRCKNCSHVIIVRGDQEELSEEASLETGATPATTDESQAFADEWFYVRDGEQAGPVTAEEVAVLVAQREILADTYMWREGMEDWLHIGDIPELSYLTEHLEEEWDDTDAGPGGNGHDLSPSVFAGSGSSADYDEDEATRVTTAPADEDDEAEATGLFGGASRGSERRPESLAPSYAGGGDLFDEPAARGSVGGGLFSTGESLAVSPHDASGEGRMVGQRNENSVLFSLDTLQSVETDGNGNLPTTEGSGLIDIKALAASQAAAGPAAFDSDNISSDLPLATPAVMPMGQRQSHRMLYGLIAAGAIVIIGLVVAIVIVLTRPTESTADPQLQAAHQPGAQTPTEGAPGERAPTPEASPAPGAELALTAPVDQQELPVGPSAAELRSATASGALLAAGIATKARGSAQLIASAPIARVAARDRPAERSPREVREEPRREEVVATPQPSRTEERTSRRERSAASDPVSEALSQLRRDDGGRSREESRSAQQETEEPAPSARSSLPEQLTTSQVSRSIRRYDRRLSECRQRSSLPSGEVLRVDVAMTLQGDGRVATARTDSTDPAASCIVDVVRDMRFDEFTGDAMNFTYPFRVR